VGTRQCPFKHKSFIYFATSYRVEKTPRRIILKKQHGIVIVLMLAIVIFVAVPLSRAEQSLSPPSVTPPSNWHLSSQTVYPNGPSEHDPAGGGSVEYTDSTNGDFVMLYYEKAQSTTYTSADLKSEAESIFARDQTNVTMSDSGTMQIAGVTAGFAKGIEPGFSIYDLELVFIKGNYYINAFAFYDNTTQSQNNVNALLNSVNTSGGNPLFSGTTLYILIGVVAAIVVVAVIIVVMRSRKKNPQQPAQTSSQQNNYPSPPPPPAT